MGARPRREWGSGSIYQTSKGYWRVSVPLTPTGLRRRRQEWQYRTEAAARRQLEAVQRRLARGLPAEESTVTLAQYAPEWLASLEVADSTKAMYRSLVTHQLGELNDIRLTRIMPADIRRLLEDRKREGYAGRTRRGILDVLRMILRLAQNDGIVERNVAELVDPPRIDAKEPVHFTAEQAHNFLKEAKGDALYSLYAVALCTGLRRGELLALSWRDVELGDSRGAGAYLIVRRGKTDAAARHVPLAETAVDALRNIERRPGLIWPHSPSYVTRHVGVICARVGLPRLTFHGLRHSAASILLAEGVDPLTIRSILGHTRVAMTGHYARPEDQQKREAMERLGRAVSG